MLSQETIKKQLDEAKANPKTKDELLLLIEEANTMFSINALRGDVVSIADKDVLIAWQKKYRSLKECPTCGHSI
jgi:hypothetical protein